MKKRFIFGSLVGVFVGKDFPEKATAHQHIRITEIIIQFNGVFAFLNDIFVICIVTVVDAKPLKIQIPCRQARCFLFRKKSFLFLTCHSGCKKRHDGL